MITKWVYYILFFAFVLYSCGSKSPEFEAGSVEQAQKLIEERRNYNNNIIIIKYNNIIIKYNKTNNKRKI